MKEFLLGTAILGFVLGLVFYVSPILGGIVVFIAIFVGIGYPEVEKQEAVRKINRNLD